MDILYTLKNNYSGEELRYSLRSLENIPHDRVFFVGGCPKWAKDIIHIPTNQTGTKYKNTTHNIQTACYNSELSEDFILMNDDFFILDTIKNPTKELNLYMGTVQSYIDKLKKRHPTGSAYIKGMEQTKEFLQGLGVLDPLSYELHIPFVLNKNKFLKMFELLGVKDIPCFHKRTVYGNLHLKVGTDTQDVKIFFNSSFVPNKLGKFISCDDMGFCLLHNFLLNKFPKKSIYEI